MGNEQSKAEAEQGSAELEAEIEALREAKRPKWKKHYEELTADSTAGSGHQVSGQTAPEPEVTDGDSPEARPEQVPAPTLVSSSKGDETSWRGYRSPGSDKLLQSFHPRKEPLSKGASSSKPPALEDEFVGFGKEVPSLQTSKVKSSLPLRVDSKVQISNESAANIASSKPPSAIEAEPQPAGQPAGTKKRPLSSAFSDERRSSTSTTKVPKRKTVSSPQSSGGHDSPTEAGSKPERPPKWYTELSAGPAKIREKNRFNADMLLQTLKEQIRDCQREVDYSKLQQRLNSLRGTLHVIAFEQVTGPLLRSHRMLHDTDGLPQLFDAKFSNGFDWPWDVRADAEELYNKWARRVFETDLLRGIIAAKPGISAAEIDKSYEGRVYANHFGNNGLLNGQWFPYQLATIRDGAHGASQKGIYGKSGEGAYSCIISNDPQYPNEDYGDVVEYYGTYSDNGSRTADTELMVKSWENQRPVRLIRSHKEDSPYAPAYGFRYDGLYRVISYMRTDPENSLRQGHCFRLERVPGQDPIRGGNGPERRPNEHEIEAYKKDKRMRGFKE